MPAITVPTRAGCTFGGYYSGRRGAGTQYYKADGTSARTWNVTSNTTLYAKWTGNPFTVTLNQQSGSGGSTSVTATYGSAMPAITVPTRAGCTFGGYYTAKNGGGTQYYTAMGASARNWDITATNTTLYAQWTANTYTVSFDANGGEGTMDPITCTYNVPTNLPPCSTNIVRDGWGFQGWMTNVNAGVLFADRARVTNLTATAGAEVTMYACWTGVTYAVTLDARDTRGNGVMTYGEGKEGSLVISSYVVGDAWDLPVPTNVNTHLSFAGWTYVDTNGVTITLTESDVVPPPSVFGGTTNLVAAWDWVADPLAVAVDAPELSFATCGTVGPKGIYKETAYDAPWFVQTEVTSNSPSAVQSGALLQPGDSVNSQIRYASWLTTTVTTNGVLTFWWKCSAPNLSEVDPEYPGTLQGYSFHFGRLEEDGGFTDLTAELTGDSGWHQVVCKNDVAGSVTFAWQFMFTDPAGKATIGGTGWVDRVTWTPDGGATVDVTTTHGVPYEWLEKNFSNEYASASGDAGKLDGLAETNSPNAKPMKVWEEYWAGTNPNDPNDLFCANIAVSNDASRITWCPDLSVTGKPPRVYHVLSAPTPSVGWAILQSNVVEKLEVPLPVSGDSGASTNRFFKVELDWKESQKN